MAVEKFTDGMIALGQRLLSPKHSQLSVQHSAAMLDGTTFGDTTLENVAGLLEWSISGEGYWDAGAESATTGVVFLDEINSQIGGPAIALTVAPKNADLGVAYFMQAVPESLQRFGQIGELIPFTLDAKPASFGVRGVIGLQPVQKVAAGNGNGAQLGTLAANQRLVAAMHVIQFNGTTMTMKVQSDDNGGFSSPTDRITFTAATGLTSEFLSTPGPITPDDRFRVTWTFTGTSFTAFVVFGIVTIQ